MSNKEENKDFLNHLKKEMGDKSSFEVPKGYFKGLSDKLEVSIEKESLKSISDVNQEVGFQVPVSYFDKLYQRVLDKIKGAEKGKIVNIFSYKSFAYVASIAIVLGISIFWFVNGNKLANEAIETNLLASNISQSIEPFEEVKVEDFFQEISTVEISFDAIDFEEEENEIDVVVNLDEVIEEQEIVKEIIEEEITTDDIDNLDIIDFSDDFEIF